MHNRSRLLLALAPLAAALPLEAAHAAAKASAEPRVEIETTLG